MNKILFGIALGFLFSGCSQKTIYVTPTITGILIDKTTNKTINNIGNIDTSFSTVNSKPVRTNNQGVFIIEHKEFKYFFISPDHRMMQSIPTDLYINIPYYNRKIIKYNDPEYKRSIESPSFYQLYQVDLGEIYLTPIEDGEEPVLGE